MALSDVASLRDAQNDLRRDAVDAGSGPGRCLLYAGPPPASVDAALSGNTLLADIPLADPSAPDSSGGVQTFDVDPPPEAAAALATGNASFFRLADSDSNPVTQGTVTATGGGGDAEMPSVPVTAGEPVQLSSLTITL